MAFTAMAVCSGSGVAPAECAECASARTREGDAGIAPKGRKGAAVPEANETRFLPLAAAGSKLTRRPLGRETLPRDE